MSDKATKTLVMLEKRRCQGLSPEALQYLEGEEKRKNQQMRQRRRNQ